MKNHFSATCGVPIRTDYTVTFVLYETLTLRALFPSGDFISPLFAKVGTPSLDHIAINGLVLNKTLAGSGREVIFKCNKVQIRVARFDLRYFRY